MDNEGWNLLKCQHFQHFSFKLLFIPVLGRAGFLTNVECLKGLSIILESSTILKLGWIQVPIKGTYLKKSCFCRFIWTIPPSPLPPVSKSRQESTWYTQEERVRDKKDGPLQIYSLYSNLSRSHWFQPRVSFLRTGFPRLFRLHIYYMI